MNGLTKKWELVCFWLYIMSYSFAVLATFLGKHRCQYYSTCDIWCDTWYTVIHLFYKVFDNAKTIYLRLINRLIWKVFWSSFYLWCVVDSIYLNLLEGRVWISSGYFSVHKLRMQWMLRSNFELFSLAIATTHFETRIFTNCAQFQILISKVGFPNCRRMII